MNAICCLILATVAVVAAYSPGQLPVFPGSTKSPQSCQDDIGLYQCADVTKQCSQHFYDSCTVLTGSGQQTTYFPNCFNHKTEDEANRAMKDLLAFKNSLPNEECKSLLQPLMCFGLYPICYGGYRLAPCPEFCETFVQRCVNPNVTLPLDCSKLFRTGPCTNNTRQGECIKPPNGTSVPTPPCKSGGFEISTNMSLPNCTGVTPSKCGLIRKTASAKAFKKNFCFAAHVKVLMAVLLSKPEKLVAFKVEIIKDYYFGCSNKCSGQKNVSSITYIITDDDCKDCSNQCIRPHLEIGKEYFVMGTCHVYEGLGCVWKLTGQRKSGGCVIYPWVNISKEKAKKFVKWTKEHYPCIKNCTRVF